MGFRFFSASHFLIFYSSEDEATRMVYYIRLSEAIFSGTLSATPSISQNKIEPKSQYFNQMRQMRFFISKGVYYYTDTTVSNLSNQPYLKKMIDLGEYVNLLKNQTALTKQTNWLSKLPIKQISVPSSIPSLVTCSLGFYCNVFYSNYSLENTCADLYTTNKKFTVSILVKNDVAGLLKNVQTYNQSTQSVLEVNITLNLTEQKYVGFYNFSVFYQISDAINQFNQIQNDFSVNITNPCNDDFKVLTDPVFPKEIDMPEIKDDQGDSYELTYQSKMADLFLKINEKQMTINAIESVVGSQEVIVMLLDNSIFPLSNQYKFTILITQNTTNQYESVLVQNTDIYQEYKQSLKLMTIGFIEAKITKITNTGLLTITFDTNLYESYNFTQKIQKSINISIEYSDTNSEQNQNFTDWDTLIIRFNYYFVFYDTSQKLMMKKGYQIKGHIPPQISSSIIIVQSQNISGLKDFYDGIGSASSITVSSFMGTNLFINILMYCQMNLTIIGLRVSNYYGE
ncbi:UNKNOWN [Stylonychia lemnae]|uniref:Uncharacterized protein n=1 Tax=Stylonychia lemnae TaxID=5949 RepID=A0A078AJS5_STYLE|nr:UNKNOWN [Stylonychia lemnae]|eukprot:CDW82141.1 UNKNOWN [Stylonychia lemnae]